MKRRVPFTPSQPAAGLVFSEGSAGRPAVGGRAAGSRSVTASAVRFQAAGPARFRSLPALRAAIRRGALAVLTLLSIAQTGSARLAADSRNECAQRVRVAAPACARGAGFGLCLLPAVLEPPTPHQVTSPFLSPTLQGSSARRWASESTSW